MIDLVELGLLYYGMREIPGKEHNSEILKMFDFIGHEWVDDDETAWCSAFINYLAKKLDYEHSGKLNARSWLGVGEDIKVPYVGDIVILWRESPSSWKGHVGIYISENEEHVFVLGGNQSNQVNISTYPKSRVLGYRRLHKLKHNYNEV